MGCIDPTMNYHTQAIGASIGPMFLGALVWLVYLVRKAMGAAATSGAKVAAAVGVKAGRAALPESEKPDPAKSLLEQHTRAFLLLSYLCLPTVAMMQFRALNCGEFDDTFAAAVHPTSRYLRVDTSIDCDSSDHTAFVGVDAILIVLYMLLPVGWFVMLYNKRAKLNPEGHDTDKAHKERDTDPELAHLRFLFSEYNGTQWYWEVVDTIRRITFISLMPFFGKGSTRAGIGCALALLSVIIHREACPYQNGATNVLVVAAQYQILVTFLGAMVIETQIFDFDNLTLGFALFGANLVVVGLAAAMGWQKYKHDLKHLEKRVLLDSAKMRIVMGVMNDEKNKGTNELLKEILLVPEYVTKGKIIGSGCFGDVYKGEYMGQTVAVKTMKDVTESSMQEFRGEILLTATLRHPNIINLIGACWAPEMTAMVLEWAEKGTLGDLLDNDTRGPPSLTWNDPLLKIAADVARGLTHMHSRRWWDEVENKMQETGEFGPSTTILSAHPPPPILHRPRATHDSLLTTHHSPLTTHRSPSLPPISHSPRPQARQRAHHGNLQRQAERLWPLHCHEDRR